MISMKKYSGSKTDVAQFVNDLMWREKLDYQSIMITGPEKSADYYVRIVIDGSLVDTVEMLAQHSSMKLIDTYPANTQAG